MSNEFCFTQSAQQHVQAQSQDLGSLLKMGDVNKFEGIPVETRETLVRAALRFVVLRSGGGHGIAVKDLKAGLGDTKLPSKPLLAAVQPRLQKLFGYDIVHGIEGPEGSKKSDTQIEKDIARNRARSKRATMDGGEAKDKKLGRTPDIFVRNCLTDVKHLQRLSELTPATDKVERAFLIVVLALIFLGTRKLSEDDLCKQLKDIDSRFTDTGFHPELGEWRHLLQKSFPARKLLKRTAEMDTAGDNFWVYRMGPAARVEVPGREVLQCIVQTVNLYDNQTIPESQYSQWLGEWNDMVLAAGVETQTQADETAADEADGGEPEAAAAGPVARRSKRKR